MARTALTELQQQIEAIRREAFAAGYTTAMQAVRELASRSTPDATSPTAPTRRGRRRRRTRAQAAATAAPSNGRRRKARAATRSRTTARTATRARTGARRAGGRRPQRGANAQMIGEILRAAAPRAIPPADIRRALQQRGVEMAFTSIRHALGQLAKRNAAHQVGGSNTWRHRGG